eukprot:jgi/Astpho2/1886/gw1.00038.277.1_t
MHLPADLPQSSHSEGPGSPSPAPTQQQGVGCIHSIGTPGWTVCCAVRGRAAQQPGCKCAPGRI